MSDQILDLIDGAVWAHGDAMRWTPEPGEEPGMVERFARRQIAEMAINGEVWTEVDDEGNLHIVDVSRSQISVHLDNSDARFTPSNPARLSLNGIDLSGYVEAIDLRPLRSRTELDERLARLQDFSMTISFEEPDPYSEGVKVLREWIESTLQRAKRRRIKQLRTAYRQRALARRRRRG